MCPPSLTMLASSARGAGAGTDKLRLEIEKLRRELDETSEVAERLSAIFERCPDAIFVKDLEGRYELANPSTAAFLGVDMDVLIGSYDRDLFPLTAAEEIADIDQFVVASSRPFRYEARRTYGSVERVVQTTKWPWYREGQPAGVIGVARDVTRLALDEEARHLQAAVARALLFAGSAGEGLSSLPRAIRKAVDAEAVIRWSAESDGGLEFNGVSLRKPEYSSSLAEDASTRSFAIGEDVPGTLVERDAPGVWVIGDEGQIPTERSAVFDRLDLKTAFGFPVRFGDRIEVFEILISERRAEHPDLVANLEELRSLIEGYLKRNE